MSGAKTHPYHILDPSPWPVVGAVAAFVLAVGGVHYMHGGAPWIMLLGFAGVAFTMYAWWRDVIRESMTEGIYTEPVRYGLRMGMVLFIASEVMFFVAFFWAYFNAAFLVSPGVDAWPPEGIETLNPWDLPFLNTLILLSSGLTLNWAHHALREGKRTEVIQGLTLTVILGVVFLFFQMVEYGLATFGLQDGVYPSVFYLATGFHGFHVFVGVVFLFVTLMRVVFNHFTERHHVGFEAAAWYWHFVDVVWIFLFIWVYWWGA